MFYRAVIISLSSGFCNLSATGMLDQTVLCCGVCGMFNGTPASAFFFFLRFYLFTFRERGREVEREGEKQCVVCLSCAPYWGPGLQPRHVP